MGVTQCVTRFIYPECELKGLYMAHNMDLFILNHFKNKPYQIRQACTEDVLQLLELEISCWPEPLRIREENIRCRLDRYPDGQFVVQVDERIVGVIYTQRIANAELLKNASYQQVSNLHSSQAPVLQLLSINVDPARQGEGFGDLLLEFVLQWCYRKEDIEKVVAVTRCQNYKDNSHLSLKEYLETHEKSLNGVDPILRFHTYHGAKIMDILPDYRPEDRDNQGAGVLIEYAIKDCHCKWKEPRLHELVKDQKIKADEVYTIIMELLPQEYHTNFSPALPLREMGFDSLGLLELRMVLNQRFQITLDATFFFTYPTPLSIARYFQEGSKNPETVFFKKRKPEFEEDNEIAIIGIGCRFPGNIHGVDNYWQMLEEGIDVVSEVPESRWKKNSYSNLPIHQGGYLADVDKFDADFFNISPREAERMDPQQRILLEVTWQALEHAGIDPHSLRETQSGVYLGIFLNDYEKLLQNHPSIDEFDIYYSMGNSPSVAAGRLSYFLGLHGPAMVVNTACSSSLVAVHLACQSLRNGESSLALAGGVNLILSPEMSIAFAKAGMLSPDGRCKTFDTFANGYVRSEGCGIVVLKKLSDAINDQDSILGIIRGSAVNQDGASNGLTAPNRIAQEALFYKALADGKVSPQSISYVEAHGTGTALGDPIELKALLSVYGQERTKENPLVIGSAKTNLGHTEAAAGIAGLIKVILALQHKKIPPHLHFSQLNSHIDFNQIPVVIPTTVLDWQSKGDEPLYAGVSSFGFNGTNAHVVIEEGPEVVLSMQQSKPYYLITLSAKHPDSLQKRREDLQTYLSCYAEMPLEAIAYTLNVGRSHFNYRCAFVVSSLDELRMMLEKIQIQQNVTGYFRGDDTKELKDKLNYDKTLSELLTTLKTETIVDSMQYHRLLLTIATLYVEGYNLNWNLIHQREAHQRISLPLYPFQKNRYWLNDSIPKVKTLLTEKDIITSVPKLNLKLKSEQNDLIKETPLLDNQSPSKLENSTSAIEDQLKIILKRLLYLDEQHVYDRDKTFKAYGMDSILAVEFIKQINTSFTTNLTAVKLYDYPTLATLASYIVDLLVDVSLEKIPADRPANEKLNVKIDSSFSQTEETIAIIGMAVYLPGARTLDDYWENLQAGCCNVTEVSSSRWSIENYFSTDSGQSGKSYSKWGGFIDDVDQFDPGFFGIIPLEAEQMDPQQRLFLEVSWQALEDAGCIQSLNGSRCGVYVGVMNNDYREITQRANTLGIPPELKMLGNSNSILAARIAHFLNLKGPAITIDTACSSSLVATHLACQALQRKEADLMLTGGVTLYLTETPYIEMSNAGMLSKDGLCKPFDNSADGFVPGEGCAVLVLKRLSDAVRTGDHIYGVIRGSGINQDGKTNGITAPSAESQKSLLTSIYRENHLNPEDITYVEAHGTGTKLGDPIEVQALTDAFREFTNKKQYCSLGSVKSNIGHTSATAGIASIIKVLLQLKHHRLVPSINFNQPNEHIDFLNSPFCVNTELKTWESHDSKPRLAAISSFGFSGTNAHIVIEEAPKQVLSTKQSKPCYLITLSAKNLDSLEQQRKIFQTWLKQHSDMPLVAISYTLNVGRGHFNHRCAFIATSVEELQMKLEEVQKQKKTNGYFQSDANEELEDEAIYHEMINGLIKKIKATDAENTKQYKRYLLSLANLYVKGYEINWELFYQGEMLQKISLPTYPFLKKRYWYDSYQRSIKAS